MKHIKPYNNFIIEKRASIQEYTNSDFIGLVLKDNKRFGSITRFLTLYDFKDNKVLAHIEMSNFTNKNCFEIQRSFAEKNWGPLIYDFALMSANPLSVTPSKIIKPAAINVWRYYYEMRDDVKKVKIDSTDEFYIDKYLNEMDREYKVDGNLEYLNCYYFLAPSDEYINLLQKGDFFLKQRGIKPYDVSKTGDKEFKKIYDEN